MRSAAQVLELEQLQELAAPPVVRLTLAPACHPDAGFVLELRQSGQVACICLACKEPKVRLPMLTAALHEQAAQAALALVNAAQVLERNVDTGGFADDLNTIGSRLAVSLERARVAVVPNGKAEDCAAHLQVLELVQQHGREAVLAALAAVEGVARG